MTTKDIRDKFRLPFVRRGVRVRVFGGAYGRITGATECRLRIRLDGAKHPDYYCPVYNITYYDKEGNVLRRFEGLMTYTALGV